MAAGRQDLLTSSFECAETIEPGRLCKLNSAGKMLKCTAATDKIVAISNPLVTYAAGEVGDFWMLGICLVKAGGVINIGDLITADATGRAVVGVGTFRSIGVALEGAVVNDLIAAYIYPSNIEGISGITSSAAELNILDGVTVTAAEINRLGSAVPYYSLPKISKVALNAVDTAGGVFSFTPGIAVLVSRVEIDVTTPSTAPCTIDVGVAANATTLSDTLIDGLSVAAAGASNSVDNKGTNGASGRKVSASQSVTGSVASGASAGLVGNAYIHWSQV